MRFAPHLAGMFALAGSVFAGDTFPKVVFQQTINGGCVSGSTCITFNNENGPDGGTITFPQVPDDALPVFGYLYFQYLTVTECTVDRIGDFAGATINGININELPFEEIACLDADACFPAVATHFYRVDVSAIFDQCDLNVTSFELRGFGQGNDVFGDWVEGATLMVAYCADSLVSSDVILIEHPQVTGDGAASPTITYNWDGFLADGQSAELVLGMAMARTTLGKMCSSPRARRRRFSSDREATTGSSTGTCACPASKGSSAACTTTPSSTSRTSFRPVIRALHSRYSRPTTVMTATPPFCV